MTDWASRFISSAQRRHNLRKKIYPRGLRPPSTPLSAPVASGSWNGPGVPSACPCMVCDRVSDPRAGRVYTHSHLSMPRVFVCNECVSH